MKTRLISIALSIITIIFLTSGGSAASTGGSLEGTFTYQGRLDREGAPYTGTCNFRFGLWDDEERGNEAGDVNIVTDLAVTNGLFTAELDFGIKPFNGDPRWLEVTVQCPGDSSPTTFDRQKLTASPYALFAASAPWSGLRDVPAGFADGEDNNTTFSNGNGLLLSGTTFSIDPAYTQRRVSNSCEIGSTIRLINADGSVVCQADLPGRQPYSLNTVVSDGYAGSYNSITIGADGLGLIAYPNSGLIVAHCNDSSCSSATTAMFTLPAGSAWLTTSIVIGADGLGLVSFVDFTNRDLWAAHCSDILCSSLTASLLDSDGDTGRYSSITIGTDGLGLISYYDLTNGDLNVAHCSDISCSTAMISTRDSTGDVGDVTSITIGSDGLGLISYYDSTNHSLKVAHCSDVTCSTSITYTLDSSGGVGYGSSIATGADGLGLISYYDQGNGDLKIAHCDNASCSSATKKVLDFTGNVGASNSIAIGANGLGLISYFDNTNKDLKVAHCNDITCTAATVYTLDSDGDQGWYSSITIGTDGLGLISYFDNNTYDLKVAHCSNTFCIPYFRSR